MQKETWHEESSKHRFSTEKEAISQVVLLNRHSPYWFCPMINGRCRNDCVNFEPFYMSQELRDMWLIHGFQCNRKD
jgi:hypothetical protein